MSLKKINLKRILCATLSCALVVIPITPASAATARATTMKLEKTEGTVTLKTQNGTARKISNGMRLYNGNTLKTEKYSYAYVNLDNTKAVKLDQSSSATLRQSGKELELLVKTGKLFFNVSKPLTEKEQMNVRTSTMVTGIRGTCGVVEYVTPNKSKLYLIEGQVTLGSGENATTIQGGQTATVVLQEKQTSGGAEQPGDKPGDTDKPGETDKTGKEMEQKVLVEKMTEESIPPVALQEIVNDPILQEKIEQTTELKLDKIEEALEKFEKEEAERKEQEKAEQEKENEKEETKEPEKKPEEQQPTNDSSSSSTSGGSYIPSTPSEPVVKEITLEGTVTSGAIKAAFVENDWVHIGFKTSKTATLSLQDGETLDIPGGKTLILWGKQEISNNAEIKVGNGALLCVPEGASLIGYNVNINMTSGSELQTHGLLRVNNLISAGRATIKNTNQIILGGAYTSNGNDAYDASDQAVLISKEKSVGLTDHNRLLLMTARNDGRCEYYYYADCMNKNVVEDLTIATNSVSGVVQWDFNKDAIIPKGKEMGFRGFNAQMNGYALVVQGTLRLENNVSITGTGNEVIRLSGGKLTFEGDNGTDASTGNQYTLENTGSGYVIACSGDAKGYVYFLNTNVRLKTAKQSEVVQGVTGEVREIQLPEYCNIADGYAPWRDKNSNVIGFEPVSATYEGPDLSALNRALQYNSVVTVSASINVNMGESDAVTIPKGKTLMIESNMDGSTGGFQMQKGSFIILEDGATLVVDGTIIGNGTIGNSNSVASGTLQVNSGGNIMADTIQLKGCKIVNDGIIDVGEISTEGTGTIENSNLIKTRSYTKKGAVLYSYKETPESVLICNGELSDSLNNTVLLVTATASGPALQKQCFYAQSLNTLMADRINTIKEKSGLDELKNATDIWWNFAKTTKVTSTVTINMASGGAFNADMGGNSLQVEGNLTLTNIGMIIGSGKAVISLQGTTGKLTLDRTIETSGTISNTNESDTNYAIAVSESIRNSSDQQIKHIIWEDEKLTISSKKNSSAGSGEIYIIEGCGTGDGYNFSPNWLKWKEGYSVEVVQNGVARLVAVEQ